MPAGTLNICPLFLLISALHFQSTFGGSAKKPKKDDSSNSSSEEENAVGVSYKSRGAATNDGPQDQGATATLETETDFSKDAQAIYERSLAVNKELKGKEDDKIYRGMANYAQYYEKKDTAQGNAASGSVS